MNETLILTKDQIKLITNKYQSYSLPLTTKYMLFRAKIDDTNLIIYTTYKLHIQGGSNAIFDEICSLLNIKQKNKEIEIGQNIIGTDEVGTGDFFGGIFVCACFVPEEKEYLLKDLKIGDSKKFTDSKILELAPIIKNNFTYTVKFLNNESYNQISKKRNMNEIKALMHNLAIKELISKNINYDTIIIDGFTDKNKYIEYLKDNDIEVVENVDLIQKAEDKFYAVGAASIIARYHFIKHIENLSIETGYEILKGAGANVDELLNKIINDGNKDLLVKIAKMNFKNYTKLY